MSGCINIVFLFTRFWQTGTENYCVYCNERLMVLVGNITLPIITNKEDVVTLIATNRTPDSIPVLEQIQNL